MKTSLVLVNQHGLEKSPYLHYIYNAIIGAYRPRGMHKVLGFQEVSYQKIAAEGHDIALLTIVLPAGNSIKKNLWEKINYPAIVRHLSAAHIFYLGEDLPVLKEAKGAVQWQFVPDLSTVIIGEGAKDALIKKAGKKIDRLVLADKIVGYSKEAVSELNAVIVASQQHKLLSWLPLPDKDCLSPDLYTDERLELFKNQHTSGESYFLLDARVASEADVIEYLKAFSHFKKWQRSSMRLALLLTTGLSKDPDFLEKLDAYYYKKDVEVLAELEIPELYGWIKSAYAVVIPGFKDEGLDLQLACAALGSLIVSPVSTTAKALLPGAIFELPAVDKESMGQVLISCYKSEVLRARHIRAGIEASEKWDVAPPLASLIDF